MYKIDSHQNKLTGKGSIVSCFLFEVNEFKFLKMHSANLLIPLEYHSKTLAVFFKVYTKIKMYTATSLSLELFVYSMMTAHNRCEKILYTVPLQHIALNLPVVQQSIV